MVGVPGKTITGCHTCRRRKIKCDLAQPNCVRCTRGGRTCEGYDRGAVFLNRTAQGLHKRQYLDEVRLRSTALPQTPDQMVQLPLQSPISQLNSWSIDLQGSLLDDWVPTINLEVAPIGEWIIRICNQHRADDLLEKSLGALFISTVGWRRNDPTMVLHGQTIYGHALRALQQALWDPQLVYEERTLAACQAMKLYELSQPTQNSVRSFDSHVQGATLLLLHRGPGMNVTPLSKAIAREIRHSAMISAIQYMRRSPLGASEWRAGSWHCSYDVEQSLCDKGFDLAGLAEDLKNLGQTPNTLSTGEMAISCLERALTLARELQTWYNSTVNLGWLLAAWPWPILDSIPPQAASRADRRANIDLSLFRQSIMILDYWALTLALSAIANTMRAKMPLGAVIPAELDALDSGFQLRLSKNILAVVSYASREEHGFMAASRSTFAARVALHSLRLNVGKEHQTLRAKAEAFLAHLSGNRGIRFASAIARVSGDWGDTKQASQGTTP